MPSLGAFMSEMRDDDANAIKALRADLVAEKASNQKAMARLQAIRRTCNQPHADAATLAGKIGRLLDAEYPWEVFFEEP